MENLLSVCILENVPGTIALFFEDFNIQIYLTYWCPELSLSLPVAALEWSGKDIVEFFFAPLIPGKCLYESKATCFFH